MRLRLAHDRLKRPTSRVDASQIVIGLNQSHAVFNHLLLYLRDEDAQIGISPMPPLTGRVKRAFSNLENIGQLIADIRRKGRILATTDSV